MDELDGTKPEDQWVAERRFFAVVDVIILLAFAMGLLGTVFAGVMGLVVVKNWVAYKFVPALIDQAHWAEALMWCGLAVAAAMLVWTYWLIRKRLEV